MSAAEEFPKTVPLKPKSEFGPEGPVGFYGGVGRAAYLQHPALSRSAVAAGARYSIAHAWHKWKSEPEEEMTKSQKFGNAFHLLTLEPERFRARYDRAADRCQGTLASGEQCSYSPKERYDGDWYCGTHAPSEKSPDAIETLTAGQFEACHQMTKSAETHPESNALLNRRPGLEEVTMIWTNPETGLRCKARIDRLIDMHPGEEVKPALVDLKTTESAHKEDFRRKIGRYGYWAQGSFYVMGFNTLAADVRGLPPIKGPFLFSVVEKSEPYACQVYSLSGRAREQGTGRILEVMSNLAEHETDGVPAPERSYNPNIETIGLSPWQKERLFGKQAEEQPL